MRSTKVTPANDVNLLARDATTGRALYVRAGSSLKVIVTEPGGGEQELFDFRKEGVPQAAAIDGDWAVVVEGGVDMDLSVHAVYARRVSGGDQVEIAKATDAGGLSPWPVLYGGVVYLHTASNAVQSLVGVDLATGTRSQWSVPGPQGPVVRWGDLLVWQSQSGAKAFDVRTHALVDLPANLDRLAGATLVSSDGQTIVWQGKGANGSWLRAYRAGWGASKELVLPGEQLNPSLSSWGRYAVTFVAQRHWIVDVETGQYAPLTIDWGGATVSGGLLATSEMASEKGGSAGLREFDLTSIPPLPACTR